MAKITAEILRKIAPQTKAELRDRFLPYLNEALPRYGIITELQVAGFLATAAFESQYFQKTKEGKARPSNSIWIKYQSKYWHTNMMGRGIFQTTHEKNYRTFGQKMKKKGLVTDSEMFVKNPELLEQPKWAVESACEYWETNGLDKYARQGFKGFSALQGKVNKGSALKVAHDYPNRLVVYERTRLALPDDFILGSNTSGVSQPAAVQTATDTTSPSDEPQNSEPPIIQNAEQIINTGDTASQTPAPVDVTLNAPQGMGSVQTATKVTVLGITVPPFILVIVETIKGWISDGFLDAKEIGNTVVSLIKDNSKYILIAVGLVVVVIIIKKITRELIFLVTVITHAIPGWNSITVIAPEKVEPVKKWYQFWK